MSEDTTKTEETPATEVAPETPATPVEMPSPASGVPSAPEISIQ